LTGTVAEDSHKRLAEDTVTGLPGVNQVNNQLEVKPDKPLTQSDEFISAKIKAALLFHRSTSGKTQVFVKDGTASSQAQKDLTMEYARDIDGVKIVNNEMTIAAAPDTPTLEERIDDASITAQVKMTLLTHHSTSALRTAVDTKDGIVTLTGDAKNQAELDLVTKLTRDIKGVKDVHNNMTISE